MLGQTRKHKIRQPPCRPFQLKPQVAEVQACLGAFSARSWVRTAGRRRCAGVPEAAIYWIHSLIDMHESMPIAAPLYFRRLFPKRY
jgi:hypothetical protein